jgi:hypothetical protein
MGKRQVHRETGSGAEDAASCGVGWSGRRFKMKMQVPIRLVALRQLAQGRLSACAQLLQRAPNHPIEQKRLAGDPEP